ncbi:hypothetical protein GCM10007160_00170 [Litchfieldella qijiaojingensis]|uniref:DUF6998 domain-containing protein n=1 Tax=Litchfieldella qijiaojingensis TaxID=980347 RepID=A0ABQ2Y9D0_9GAMM|nr:hypothetical protein [Halomonas qijiaojingensis]GGX76988.1 hypothetical protein GCM10007160_00170 [Halomonas qijiaojingensis]
MNLKDLGTIELLRLQSSITDELMERKIVRTKNNPIGDYTEWLVAKALGLELQPNSKSGYDGIYKNGVRVQIKGRRITKTSKSRQLSAIRNYDERDFDVLVAVIYDESFDVIEALLIPHEVVKEYASYREYVNAHILILQGAILKDKRVRCIKDAVSSCM